MDDTNLRRLKALANDNRLAILLYLRRQAESAGRDDPGCSVGEIAQQLKVGIPTVSHHLKELYRAGLIHCERQGQRVCCRVDRQALSEIQEFLGKLG